MRPVSRRTALHADDFTPSLLAAARRTAYRTQTRRADYADLVGRGAYPEVQKLPGPLHRRWFDSYLDGIIRRDLGDLRREVNPARAQSLVRALAGNHAGELVKARLANATSVPAARLARVTTEQLERLDHGEAFGSFLEGFVVAELLRQQTWTAQEFELFHYRDRAGIEVDLILELTGGSGDRHRSQGVDLVHQRLVPRPEDLA